MSEAMTGNVPEFNDMNQDDLLAEAKKLAVPTVDYQQMRGELAIMLNGQPAMIGWMAAQPGKSGMTILSPYDVVSQPEHMVILEGSIKAKILRGKEVVDTNPPYTFGIGDKVIFSKPINPVESGTAEEPAKCWFLITYPDSETAAAPQVS